MSSEGSSDGEDALVSLLFPDVLSAGVSVGSESVVVGEFALDDVEVLVDFVGSSPAMTTLSSETLSLRYHNFTAL